MSSLYGSDAMGGVINIITRKVGKEWHGTVRADATLQEDSKSGDIFQTNAYASGPLIDGLLGLKVSGLLSHRSEDKIIDGYNQQRMRNGTATFTLTPDDNNEFDFDIGHYVQDRNSTPGRTLALNGKIVIPNMTVIIMRLLIMVIMILVIQPVIFSVMKPVTHPVK